MKKLLLLCFVLMGMALQSHAEMWTAWNAHYFHNGQLALYTRACNIDLGNGQYKHVIQFARNTKSSTDIYVYSVHLNDSVSGDCYIGPDYEDVHEFSFIDDTPAQNSSDWNFTFREA